MKTIHSKYPTYVIIFRSLWVVNINKKWYRDNFSQKFSRTFMTFSPSAARNGVQLASPVLPGHLPVPHARALLAPSNWDRCGWAGDGLCSTTDGRKCKWMIIVLVIVLQKNLAHIMDGWMKGVVARTKETVYKNRATKKFAPISNLFAALCLDCLALLPVWRIVLRGDTPFKYVSHETWTASCLTLRPWAEQNTFHFRIS